MRWRPLPAALAPAVLVGACALGGCGSSGDEQPAAQAPVGPADSGPADPGPADPTDPTGATSAAPASAGGSGCAKAAPAELLLSVIGAPVTGPQEKVTSPQDSTCTYSANLNGGHITMSLRLVTAYQPSLFEKERASLRSEGYDVADLYGLGTKAFSARLVTGSTANTVLDAYRGDVQVFLSGGMSIGQEMAVAGRVLAAL